MGQLGIRLDHHCHCVGCRFVGQNRETYFSC